MAGARRRLLWSLALAALGLVLMFGPVARVMTPVSQAARIYTCTVLTSNCNDNWMLNQADRIAQRPLSQLVIPGTHDSGTYAPIDFSLFTGTQDLSFYQQLELGIRYFDIRIAPNCSGSCTPTDFVVHHGPINTNLSITTVLQQFDEFTGLHPQEIVIMNIQTDGADQYPGLFSPICSNYINTFVAGENQFSSTRSSSGQYRNRLVKPAQVSPFLLFDLPLGGHQVTTVQDIWNLGGPRVIARWDACQSDYTGWSHLDTQGNDAFYANECYPRPYLDLLSTSVQSQLGMPTLSGIDAGIIWSLAKALDTRAHGTDNGYAPTGFGANVPGFYNLQVQATQSNGCFPLGPEELNLGVDVDTGLYNEELTLDAVKGWWSTNQHNARAYLNILSGDFVEKIHLVSYAEDMNVGPTMTLVATTADGQPFTSGGHTTRGLTLTVTCQGYSGAGAGDTSWHPSTIRVIGPVLGSSSGSGSNTLDDQVTVPYRPGTVTEIATCIDAGGKVAQTSFVINFDPLPTVTVTAPPPPTGQAGYFNRSQVPVTVSVSATDPTNVTALSCTVNGVSTPVGGATGPSTPSASGKLSLSADGTSTVVCTATNGAGHTGAAPGSSDSATVRIDATPPGTKQIKIDKTRPVITGSANPPADANGWNNNSVTVSFTCADTGPVQSGIQTNTVAGATVSGEGVNQSVTSTGACVDNAGNVANPVTVAGINIDKTPPLVRCSASPNMLWPPDHKLVAVTATVTVTDALSGPAGFTLASVTSNEPDDGLGNGDTAHDITGFTSDTPDTSGWLRAERSGTGSGRVYTLTYEGADKAGTTSTCQVTVTVPREQR